MRKGLSLSSDLSPFPPSKYYLAVSIAREHPKPSRGKKPRFSSYETRPPLLARFETKLQPLCLKASSIHRSRTKHAFRLSSPPLILVIPYGDRVPRAPPLSNLPPHTGHKTIPLPLNRERKHIAFIVELSRFSWRSKAIRWTTLFGDHRKELSTSSLFSESRRGEERKGRKYPALSHFHPCAGFELFRQLPEVSVGRGVSRFMQNGTQLPGEVASSTLPYNACGGPSTPPPPRFFFLLLHLLYRPRKGGPLRVYMYICILEQSGSWKPATLLLLSSTRRRRRWFVSRLDWNFRRRGEGKISYNVLKGVGINRHLRAG